ncbi:MAG: twin-arginine translocation signal domain-containing protein [Acidimicrobiales bacterium]|nr:twin-arginine translocation signal domain-containing protein [Acidimicrobiales bacterium]
MSTRRAFLKGAAATPLVAAIGGGVLAGTAQPAGARSGPVRQSRPPFLFGLHVPDGELPTALTAAEASVGRRADVVLVFGILGRPSVSRIAALQADGYEVALCLEWWDGAKQIRDPRFTLASIAAGDHDAAAMRWFEQLATLERPVHLRPLHEGNGDWYPWGVNNGLNRVADFVPAFRRVSEQARSIAGDRVRIQWCINRKSFGAQPVPFAAIYPGADWVDEFAVNGYNRPEHRTSASFENLFRPAFTELKSYDASKPLWIGETASTEKRGDKAAWIDGMFRALRTTMAIDVLTWFHERIIRPDDVRDWPFDSSAASLAAFRRGIVVTRGVSEL